MTTILPQQSQLVTVTRANALQALAAQAGQVLDAKIIGAAPNGGTQVEIKGQLLNLLLPVAVKAGETIKLEVQGSGQQLKLALQLPAAAPPPSSPAPAAPNQQAMPLPQASTSSALQPQPSATPAAAQQPTTALPTQNQPTVTTPTTPPAGKVAAQVASYPTASTSATTSQPPPTNTNPPFVSAESVQIPAGSAPPMTAKAALAQMVQTALPSQGPITAVTAALDNVLGKVVLPEPVIRAAQQVLSSRVAINPAQFDGAALQVLVKNSGVFQEATLANPAMPTQGQTDMKAALLTLRQTLTNWLGQQSPMVPVAQVPPPMRGSVPRSRTVDAPALDTSAAPEEIGKHLLARTESALSRVRLHQNASLPDPVTNAADWSMDLPVMVGNQQTLLQFQIHRDQHNDAEPAAERGWQMRFALALPEMGEVGAQVSLRAGTTGVMLWATDPEASAALDSEVNALRDTLSSANLRIGTLIVRRGEPPTPFTVAASGHFVDAKT